jgi:hypothetical protein
VKTGRDRPNLNDEDPAMHTQPHTVTDTGSHLAVHPAEEDVEVDVDNDPGNEDPGSQFDRDATVPLIDPDE